MNALRAAEQVGRDERANRRDEHQNTARDHPRQRQRKDDAPERSPVVRAEIVRRFDQPEVEALDRRVDRQDHEGQFAVDQADQHGEARIEQLQRLR